MDDPIIELARAVVIGLQQAYLEKGRRLRPSDAEAAVAAVLRRHLVFAQPGFASRPGFSPLGGFPFGQRARWPGV